MPILSVIIPTHNRQKYAINSVETILNNFSDTEVIVSDTSDDTQIFDSLVFWINSGRLIYKRPNEQMDVVRNFEFALNFASGDYLIYVGDDDCVGPEVEKIAYWAKKNQIDAISCPFCATYGWPNYKSQYFGSKFSAKLAVRKYTGNPIEIKSSYVLNQALDQLGLGPLGMPRLYHGMVSKELICKIKNKYGHVFGGVSPDVYNAALITYESKKIYHLDFPFILIGASGESTAGAGATGTHKGKLRENSHIGAFKNLEWHNMIPEFYSPETVWAYSLVKAVELINDSKLQPNFARLYLRCFLFHKDYHVETSKCFKLWIKKIGNIKAAWHMFRAICSEFLYQFKRVWRRFPNIKEPFPKAVVFDDVESISVAFKILSECSIKDSKLKLKNNI